MPKYLEVEKLEKVFNDAAVIKDFLNWLQEENITLCKLHSMSTIERRAQVALGTLKCSHCGYNIADYFYRIHVPSIDLIYKYFEIDKDRLEQERCKMLEEYRNF